MKQFIVYSDSNDNFYQVAMAAKKDLEELMGKMTQEEYEAFIWSKIPKYAIDARDVDYEELLEILKGRDKDGKQ